jgi:exopolysaccharide production protein ExoQ
MPPALAACFCVGFIFCLFFLDRTKSSGVSGSIWIPTVWVAILSVKPVGFWLNNETSASSILDGSPADRAVFLFLMVLGIFVLMRRQIDWGHFLSSNVLIWLFYFYCAISVLWSDYSFVSFKRWIKDFGNIIMILVILTEIDPIQAVRRVFVWCAFLLIPLSVLFIKYYLEIGRGYNEWTGEPAFTGVATDKNALGRLSMISALVMLWSFVDGQEFRGWWYRIRVHLPECVIFSLCIWLLIKGNSATSKLCFGLGTLALLASRINWIRRSPGILVTGGCALLLLSLLFFAVPDLRGIVAGSLNRQVHLTDRTEIYEGCVKLGTDPLFGVGFASFWLTRDGMRLGRELQVGEAHNGYLETYLNTGLIGVALLLGVISMAARNTVTTLLGGSPVGPFYAALFVAGVIYNYTEAAFNTNSLVGFAVFLIANGVISAAREETDSAKPQIIDEDSAVEDFNGEVQTGDASVGSGLCPKSGQLLIDARLQGNA